ncbi:shikimate kinase [Leptolyngbya sp. NIES-3755]|nr:shikimate kinase [Leptolyngbya sp. NIES-3755]
MKTLYLMCGMPFSGKTTLAKSICQALQCSYISLDEINEARSLFGGEGIPIEEWEKTHAIANEQLRQWMPSGADIVLDDTSCFRWLRDRYRNLAEQYHYRMIVIYLDLSIDEIRSRLQQNEMIQTRLGVKAEIINEMWNTFEPPRSDEVTILYTPDQNIDQWITKHFQ